MTCLSEIIENKHDADDALQLHSHKHVPEIFCLKNGLAVSIYLVYLNAVVHKDTHLYLYVYLTYKLSTHK